MREGHTLQQHLRQTSSHMDDDQKIAHASSNLMFQGKVQAALHVVSVEGKGSSLPLDSIVAANEQQLTTVREELVNTHPANLHMESLWFSPTPRSMMSTLCYLSALMVMPYGMLCIPFA